MLGRRGTSKRRLNQEASPSQGTSPWLIHLGVILGYTTLTLIFTYPLLTRFATEIIGRGNDLWIFQWNNWWIRRALSQGLDVYHTTAMFHPQGVPLYFHSFSWFNSGLWLIFRTLISSIPAHNMTVVIGYVSSGYAMYLLTKELTGSHPGAFVAGTVFAFFRHRGVNHVNLFSVQWIPLTALFLTRLAKTGRLRLGLWAGLSMAMAGLCGWHQLLMLALWIAVWLGYHVLAHVWDEPRGIILGTVVAAVVCAALTAPLLWPLVHRGLIQGEAALTAGSLGPGGTDLLGYFVPGENHPLIRGGPWEGIYGQLYRVSNTSTFMGFVALGFLVWALRRRGDASMFWFAALLVSSVLALGPVLEINATQFHRIPMPYRLVAPTLPGSALRRPSRLSSVYSLSAAAIVGIGAADVFRKLRQRPVLRVTVLSMVSLAILCEHAMLPFPTSRPVESAFFDQLHEEAGEFAVADFPIGYHAHDKWYLYAQTVHERPMVGGFVSRVPRQAHDFIDRVPVLTEARGSAPHWGELDDISRQLLPLAVEDVRYVILHKYRASARREGTWREWFAARPIFEDDYVVAFRTAPAYGRDFDFIGEIGDGVGIVEAALSADVLPQEGLLEVRVVWGTRAAPSTDWQAYAALTNSKGEEVQRVTFVPCGDWPTRDWGRNSLARATAELKVDPYLNRGRYDVVVGLVDEATGRQAGEPVAVGQVDVQAIERTFAMPTMTHESNASFGSTLKLLGYDLGHDHERLTLRLHWQALRRMDRSYTFFVHLIDARTGELVRQADVIPRDWTYPTIWWEAGEVVSHEVKLSLSELPSGAYRVRVGAYDGDSGDRIPAREGVASTPRPYMVLDTIDVP